MSRAYQKGIYHKQPGLVKLLGKVTVGSSGAITAATTSTPGVSIARTSTGKYTITLADSYYAFLGGHVVVEKTTVADVVPQFNSSDMAAKEIIIDFFSVEESPNVVRDPENCVWYFELNMDQSSASQY